MDLREMKTLRAITNAFLQLRRRKPLERITVKELSELAEISKATFYLHYRDIYDLSEHLQEEVIQRILGNIAHPEYCLTNAKAFTEELFYAFYAEQSLIETLFSGTQNTSLPMRVEKELLRFMKTRHPGIDTETEMLLTYTIHGGYHVYQKYYKEYRSEDLIAFVGRASHAIHEMK